ncbi:hypothetical protein AAC387_Pa05g1352 [Persea americana]
MEKEILMKMDSKMFCPGRSFVSQRSRKDALGVIQKNPFTVPYGKLWKVPRRLVFVGCAFTEVPQRHLSSVKNPISQLVPRQSFWRIFAMSIDLEEEPALLSKGDNLSDNDEVNRNDSSEKFVSQHLDSHELKSLLADSERSKLVKKLSEANQYNRFLKRQLQFNEDTLINFKSELAVLELELQTSVGLAEEVAKSGTYQGSRKINGKYVPSYLLSRLEAIHRRLKEQIKGIDAVKVRDVEFFWYGMAEIVQVMGSFDGWSHGEHMSPEYQGGFTKFSTVLKLRPGRYEIKFLVDGEWHLSPELPIIGEGLMQNNLLIVE